MTIDPTRIAALLPGYDIGGLIGSGGFGDVFLARHRRLEATRTVKAVIVRASDGPDATQRFLTEARIMTALDHPHLVRVFDYAEDGPLRLLVMEYLPGGTAAERLAADVSPETACAWGLALADGLDAAHARGVIHRDIKPTNVLFTADGAPRLTDFGIAKVLGTPSDSVESQFLGTPLYMAPEQVNGEPIGPATDLYGLGILLYRALTGRLPFPPELEPLALIWHQLVVPPAPMPGVPPSVRAAVERLLRKDPADRPNGARRFAVELARAATADLGVGWLDRADVPLRVDHEVLAATTRAPSPSRRRPTPRRVPTAAGLAPPTVEAPHWGAPAPGSTPPPVRRPRVARLAAAAIVLVLGLWGAYTTVGPHPTLRQAKGDDEGVSWMDRGAAAVLSLSAGAPVREMAIDLPGSALAAATADGTIRIWDLATGHELGVPRHVGRVTALAISQRGVLATGDSDGWVRFWDVRTGAEIGVPHRAEGRVLTMAFDQAGDRLAAGTVSGTVYAWGTDATPRGGFHGHAGPVRSVSFGGAHGEILASGSDDGTVRIWSGDDDRPVADRTLQDPAGGVLAVTFSPIDDTVAAVDDSGDVWFWNARTGDRHPRAVRTAGPVKTIAYDRTGTRLAMGGANDTVAVCDTDSYQRVGPQATGYSNAVASIAFNAGGANVAASAADATIRVRRVF